MIGRKTALCRVIALMLCIIMVAAFLPIGDAYAASLSTPTLKSASKSGSSIVVKWDAVSGAAKYRVFRKGPADTSWKILGDTTSTSYSDSDVKNDTKYTYTVRCISSDGKSYTSSYNSTGISCTYYTYATPTLVSAKVAANGIVVTWNAVSGAAKYRVYRKVGSGSWGRIGDTTGTSFTDTTCKSGTTYIYTVRCISADAQSYTSSYNSKGVSCGYYGLATPKLVSAAATTGGIKVTWQAVNGAAKYRLFRKTSSTSWAKVIDTTATSYTDTSCSAGVAYSYTVRCITSDGKSYTSGYDETGKKATYYPKVAVTSLECINGGITVKWNNVKASSYQLYRKASNGDGTWKSIAKVGKDVTSYTDTNVVSRLTYTYQVRALSESGSVAGSYDTTGKSTQYFDTPELDPNVTISGNSFTISWHSVAGAPKYRVFRKVNGESWKKLADTTALTYTDTTGASGITYVYTVRCVSADGSAYVSGYDTTGVKASYYGAPTLIKAETTNSGIEVSWNTVGTCLKYQIYRRTENSSWQPLDTATLSPGAQTGSFTDTTAVSGRLYYYSVACMSGSSVISDKDPAGVFCTRYETPGLSSASNVANGVKFTWKSVDGVSLYRVFRKEASGSTWKQIADVRGTSYIDTSVVSAGTYIYTVRGVAANGTYATGYNTTGLKITYFAPPVVVSATIVGAHKSTSSGTILVKWEPVDGATYYNIWRKTGTGSWTKVKEDVTGTSYSDTPPTSNKTYSYTVRVSNGSKKDISWYDATGKSTAFLKIPTLKSTTVATGAISVNWGGVDGAKGFTVYRKVENGSWVKLKSVGSTTYTYQDKTVMAGQKYFYTVRAYNDSVTSGWNDLGISATAK